MTETVIQPPGPIGPLEGTPLQPPLPARAVALIIPGSGPTDRDGNNRFEGQAATYRLLAGSLAARGVASVRIDKRGLFGSHAPTRDPNAVTIDDYAEDVHRWIQVIRERTGLLCV